MNCNKSFIKQVQVEDQSESSGGTEQAYMSRILTSNPTKASARYTEDGFPRMTPLTEQQ